jgi:hypothetical protein
MPDILANHGLVCINYPEYVLLPGEKRESEILGKEKRSKGISDLTLQELGILTRAFDDPVYPLHFVKSDHH